MTPAQADAIRRRARTDAQALRNGWDALCPYHSVDEAALWRRELDKALQELGDKK